MVRILNIEILNDKCVVIVLIYIFGIGKLRSKEILVKCNINENVRIKDLLEL